MSKFGFANGAPGLVLGGVAAAGVVVVGLYASGYLFPDPDVEAPATQAVVPEAADDPAPAAQVVAVPDAAEGAAPSERSDTLQSDTAQSDIAAVPETADVASATEPSDGPAGETARDGAGSEDADRTDTADNASEPQPEADPTEAPEVAATAQPEPEAPATVPPSFDLVRVSPDGQTLVAGRAPGAREVTIEIDGVEAGRAEVDAMGTFVAFLDLPDSANPRVVSLVSDGGAGRLESDDQVILAPVARVAEAPTPEATPDAEPDASVEMAAVAERPAETQTEAAPTEVSTSESDTGTVSTAAAPEQQDEVQAAAAPIEAEKPDSDSGTVSTAAAPERQNEAQASAAPIEAETQDTASGTPAADQRLAGTTEPASPTSEAVETADTVSEDAPTVTTAVTQPEASAPEASPLGLTAPNTEETEVATTQTPDSPSVPVAATPPDAPSAPAVILSTEAGVNVLQPGGSAPEILDQIALDAITYETAGEVVLSGRGSASEFVRIYLDNQPIQSSRIGTDGQWRAELPDVDSGTYTLRVDEVDAQGEVISRVESPFRREDPVALAEAVDRAEARSVIQMVTVQPGNTLWAIARDRYGEGLAYVKVFEANRDSIRDPDLIYPGQVFSIPE